MSPCAGVLRDLLNTECAKPRPMTDAELFENGEGAGSMAGQGRVAWWDRTRGPFTETTTLNVFTSPKSRPGMIHVSMVT